MNEISIEDVLKINNPIIIDIRNSYDYNLGHIKGAINIPYYNLINNHGHYLKREDIYYLYCSNGRQSLEIVKRLNYFGYYTINIKGGYEEYLKY